MIAWHWEDHCFEPCNAVPLSDRGFRYGMSVFESILLHRGRPVFLREHLTRLSQSCATCGFKFDARALEQVETNLDGLMPDGFARVYVTAGDGAVSSAAEQCRIYLFAEPRPALSPDVYERGYDLALSQEIHQPVFGGLKTANYWANITALNRAHPKNEALLFNANGELISACMANVFVVQKGEITTPALKCGARNGVVRAWVMQRRKVRELAITRRDLENAEGMMLTSSWLGVMPVRTLEGRALPASPLVESVRGDYGKAIFQSS